jgi:DNA-binding MurR/RpiR family transcriptional regulator
VECLFYFLAATEALWLTFAMPSAPPRDFTTLRRLIVEKASDLPRRLTQVASFALENPDEMALGTVASIAEMADVQPSTLVRFAQALGYPGFSDLQDIFRTRMRERVLNYEERIDQLREHARASGKAGAIFDGFAEASAKSIANLRERIDAKQLEEAVNVLAKADTIYLIGLRRSFPISSYMAYAFGKLGIRNRLVDAIGGLAAEETSFATNRDAVLAISFTPYAAETVALTQALAGRKLPIVAITDSPFSPLVALADPWIEVQEANFEGFRSMAATIALAMTLTVAVAERRSSRKST